MSTTQNPVTATAEAVRKDAIRQGKTLLKALGPKDTKERKLIQAKLRSLETPTSPLDMKEYSAKLLKEQRTFRFKAHFRSMLRKHEANKHRIRVRVPRAYEGKVIDTRKDSRGNLYFELPNGQVLNANRTLGVRLYPPNVHGDMLNYQKWNKSLKRRLGKRLGNPVLVNIARREVEANATREAA